MTKLSKSQIETLKATVAGGERHINAMIEKRMREDDVHVGMAQALVSQTLKGSEAYLELFEAQTQLKSAEIDALTAEMDADIEAFAIDKNIRPSDARARLEIVSPTFLAKVEALQDLYRARFVALDNTKATQTYQMTTKLAAQATAKAQAEAPPAATKLPSLEKFDRHVMAIALKRSVGKDTIDLGAATEWALGNDPVAKALKREYDRERIAVANGYRLGVNQPR